MIAVMTDLHSSISALRDQARDAGDADVSSLLTAALGILEARPAVEQWRRLALARSSDLGVPVADETTD